MCKNNCVCNQLLKIECMVQKSTKESISFNRTKAPFVNEINAGGGCSMMQTPPTEGIKGGDLIDIDVHDYGK